MATVDVVIPSYGGIKDAARSALGEMVQFAQCRCTNGRSGALQHMPWECTRGKHSVGLVPTPLGKSVVHIARNHAMAKALYGQADGRPPAEYFFLMDDDMVGAPEDLARLLSHRKDLIFGICTLRRFPPVPNIRFWLKEEKRFRDPLVWDWNADLMEIDAAGAAFGVVSRHVFEDMAQAHLNCTFERAEDARKYPKCDEVHDYWDKRSALRKKNFEEGRETGNIEKMDCWWFQHLSNIHDEQIGEVSEDISFCWKAKQLGYRIYADPQVTPGHLGSYAYSIADYRKGIEKQLAAGKLPIDGLPTNEVGL